MPQMEENCLHTFRGYYPFFWRFKFSIEKGAVTPKRMRQFSSIIVQNSYPGDNQWAILCYVISLEFFGVDERATTACGPRRWGGGHSL